MLSYLNPSIMMIVRKYSYFLAYLPLVLPFIGFYFGEKFDQVNLFAYFTLFILYFILPILDYLVGKDNLNFDEKKQIPELHNSLFHRLLPVISVVGFSTVIVWGGYMMATYPGLDLWGQIGLILSVGTVSGYVGINVSHELIHRKSKWEQAMGGFAMSMVSYGGFKVEHIRGHHVNVATPKDASSSRYDQSLYTFLPVSLVKNWLSAWRLEKEHLQKLGYSAFSVRNELIWWNAISLLVMVLFVSFWGVGSLVFFILQGLIAVLSLEVVNYIQHYGLHRRKLADGKYERVSPYHSWNSSYFLTNAILLQLQRHSDHHANPTRPYQTLRSFKKSPQMPFGIATMILLAFIPPVWKRLMNPRVQYFYKGDVAELVNAVPAT